MRLWQSLKAGVYDPEFYRSIKERSAGSALGYFALLILVISVITAIVPVKGIASFVFLPSAEKDSLRQQALDLYPDELRFAVGNGKLSMNVASPFIVPMPEGAETEHGRTEDVPKNLLVIDTENPIALDDFKKYDTLIVLGADNVGFLDAEKGKIQIQDLSEVFDTPFALDKAQYVSFIGWLEKIAQAIGVALIVVIPLFIFTGMMFWYPIYLLFGALFIWLAAQLRGAQWKYGTAYKAGMYLLTVPLLYQELVAADIIPALPVPLIFTVLLFVMALLNISKEKSVESASVVVSAGTVPEVPIVEAPQSTVAPDPENGSMVK